ncbi:MAG: response regulator, partial [Prevotellaceae bacterium]|nr:response regulator [Prevotellaceae bacterium]
LWFGGMSGITYLKHGEIVVLAKHWNVRVTDFYLHSKPVRKGMLSGRKPIIDTAVFKATDFYLSHKDNSFSIEFATTQLDSPERVTYLYAMNNTPWFQLPKGINRVSFSSLAPGTYHFRIKAKDSLLESEAAEVTIHIAHAWWGTWWAWTIYVIIILAIAGTIFVQRRHHSRIQREMERHIQAEQLNEAKLQFFIDVSHEIRTPLSLIVSPLQKLMAGDADSARQKTYRLIYRNLERLLQLMNQLLDIRKIDKGQLSLVYRQTDMVAFIADLCDTFREQAEKQHISFTFHHDGIKTLPLWIDPARFDKVILNILSNAFKFTSDGGHIDVWLATGEDAGTPGLLQQYAEITIADDGVGISPEETGHIFERFYQVQRTRNISHQGTGIGLHLTHSLVELHHGTIRVADNPDGCPGCRFIVRVPLGDAHLRGERVEAAQPPAAPPAETAPAAAAMTEPVEEKEEKVRAKTKYRVLVAEDDEELRRYICRELSADYHTLACGNGKEALELIFSKAPDAVVSDIVMPGMDGFTLCQKLKQNVNLNHLPVILLTARTKEEDKIEGLETGADAYITKPFNMEILKNTVRNLIRGREQLRNTFSGKQAQDDKLKKIDVPSSDEKLMERIMRVINANMSNPNLTVDMITREVGISRVHLNRKLKELTNQTTRDFIRNIRLKQAAELLTKKRYTISEVADLTGFTDSNNFSTAFKELYGTPPTLYMKQHQDRPSAD